MEPRGVFWNARLTPHGERELCYAIDLGRRLGVSLTILVPEPARGIELTRGGVLGRTAIELARIRAIAERHMGTARIELVVCHAEQRSFLFPPASILVGNAPSRTPRHISLMAPADETNLEMRGRGELCIPLGSGSSGEAAIRCGVARATQLHLPILFYHTTWKNEATASQDPKEHVCFEARTHLSVAEAVARRQNIACRTIVQTAPDVAEGIVRAALREHCLMIFMVRSATTGRGSYVDRVLEQSPIPVWVAAREEESS